MQKIIHLIHTVLLYRYIYGMLVSNTTRSKRGLLYTLDTNLLAFTQRSRSNEQNNIHKSQSYVPPDISLLNTITHLSVAREQSIRALYTHQENN